MIEKFYFLLFRIGCIILNCLLYLYRIFRLIKRGLNHTVKFIPVLIIMLIVVILIYIIGVELEWYTEGFIDALKDLKSFLISIVITAYFITFLNTERQRKKDLKSQYAIRYDIITSTTDLLISFERVFNIGISSLALDVFDDNQNSFDNILAIINIIDFKNIDVDWDRRIQYRGNFSKRIYLNSMTQELFNIIQDSCREQYGNLRDVKRQIYEEYQFLRMEFFPLDAFCWDRLEKEKIKEKISYILRLIKSVDNIISKPWVVNPRLTKALRRLYMRIGE